MVDDDKSQPADLSADVLDDLDDAFAQKALWEGDGGSSFTVEDRSIISTALARPSKTVPALGSDFSNNVKGLFDELGTSKAATVEAEMEAKYQKGSVSEAEKSRTNAWNDVVSLPGRVAVADTCEVELLCNASVALNIMARILLSYATRVIRSPCRVGSWPSLRS